PRCRDRVTTALELDPRKVGTIGIAVVRIYTEDHQFAGLEILHHEGAGAERFEIERRAPGIRSNIILEGVLRQNDAEPTHKGEVPAGRVLLEGDLDRMRIQRIDALHQQVNAQGWRSGSRG